MTWGETEGSFLTLLHIDSSMNVYRATVRVYMHSLNSSYKAQHTIDFPLVKFDFVYPKPKTNHLWPKRGALIHIIHVKNGLQQYMQRDIKFLIAIWMAEFGLSRLVIIPNLMAFACLLRGNLLKPNQFKTHRKCLFSLEVFESRPLLRERIE